MKKLVLATLCASAFALTACDKKPTDSTTTSGSDSKPAVTVAALSTNNTADIQNDFTALQSLSTAKAKEAVDFQTEVMQASQSGNKEALKTVVSKMQVYVDGFNKSLDDLPLKSTEVAAIRDKMKESNKLGVEIAELGVSSNTPDPQKMMELQKKATESQQSLLTDMQAIQTKINAK